MKTGGSNRLFIIMIFLILISLSYVNAITGSIGNARMILRLEKGDIIEKYVLVKNVNDVPVDIEIFASGELTEFIKIKDDKFHLEPGAQKKAYFMVEAGKDGTTESKINVQFKPSDGKNGIGLSSTVIVVTGSGGVDNSQDDSSQNDNSQDDSSQDDSSQDNNINLDDQQETNTDSGNKIINEGNKPVMSGSVVNNNSNSSFGVYSVILTITFFLFLFLFILLLFAVKNKKYIENIKIKESGIKPKKSIKNT